MRDIRKVMLIGFIFGIIFAIIAFIGGFRIKYQFIWMIPFITAALCGLGVVIALFISNSMTVRGYTNIRVISVISFLAAALINSLLVLLLLTYFGIAELHPQAIFLGVLGLAMGAIYGIYRYRVESITEKMKFLEELAAKNRQLQEASRKLAITEERNRMSRELHDSVSQGLHGLVFAIHSLRNELVEPSPRAATILAHMEETANSTLNELKTMIEELKPSLLAEEGLEGALRVTLDLFTQRQQIPVESKLEIPSDLRPDLEMTIYRITQEALANVEKHSSAKHLYYEISGKSDILRLTIRDDGIGFTPGASSGNGLRNMLQRAEEVQGNLDIISKPGMGTSIIAEFPLK